MKVVTWSVTHSSGDCQKDDTGSGRWPAQYKPNIICAKIQLINSMTSLAAHSTR